MDVLSFSHSYKEREKYLKEVYKVYNFCIISFFQVWFVV